jgi:hypothetical protein
MGGGLTGEMLLIGRIYGGLEKRSQIESAILIFSHFVTTKQPENLNERFRNKVREDRKVKKNVIRLQNRCIRLWP